MSLIAYYCLLLTFMEKCNVIGIPEAGKPLHLSSSCPPIAERVIFKRLKEFSDLHHLSVRLRSLPPAICRVRRGYSQPRSPLSSTSSRRLTKSGTYACKPQDTSSRLSNNTSLTAHCWSESGMFFPWLGRSYRTFPYASLLFGLYTVDIALIHPRKSSYQFLPRFNATSLHSIGSTLNGGSTSKKPNPSSSFPRRGDPYWSSKSTVRRLHRSHQSST